MTKKSIKSVVTIGMFLCTLILVQTAEAQLNLPRISPAASVTHTIGLTKVTIDYSSPAVKGREVWGKLVPYGLTTFAFGPGNPAPWRAGANENTVITFTHDVKIEGKDLAAGSYGLFMIPSETEWVIIFSKNHTSWGSFFYDEKEDVLRVKVTPVKAEFNEWLAYGFDNNTANSADAFLHWEKLKIKFKIEVDTEKIVFESISNQLKSTAGFTWLGWMQAATYCLGTNQNLDMGLKWINQSVAMDGNATNRNILGYILMAQKKTDEALNVFKENIKKYPDNWNAFDSLGENLAKAGKTEEAVKYYKLAHKKAPAQQKKRIEGILEKLQGK